LNKQEIIEAPTKQRKKWQTHDLWIVGLLALIVLIAVWFVFRGDDNVGGVNANESEAERSISVMLSQIEGVGDAEVTIYETEDGVQSVVVVCEGAKDLQVIINVREAVAAALGTQEKAVKVYLKKE
jgi:hypothetical protein